MQVVRGSRLDERVHVQFKLHGRGVAGHVYGAGGGGQTGLMSSSRLLTVPVLLLFTLRLVW